MIEFDNGIEIANKFRGSEEKTTIIYDGEIYMLKYPDPVRSKKNELSYMNNQFSEYIGCHIFKSCGFDVQETSLGYFTNPKGKKELVVGCKDFTQNGAILHEFSLLQKQARTESPETRKLSIENVYDVIDASAILTDKEYIISKFWDMFVVDALLGNKDRHLDNWGFLIENNIVSFAPIYDCGSALAALISDEKMSDLLENNGEFRVNEYNCFSCYCLNGKKIFYLEIFKNPPPDLAKAIIRIVPKINISEIENIIEATPCLSDVRIKYLTKAITMRYEQILLPAYKREMKKQIPYVQQENNVSNKNIISECEIDYNQQDDEEELY